jgi:hypothetical protein
MTDVSIHHPPLADDPPPENPAYAPERTGAREDNPFSPVKVWFRQTFQPPDLLRNRRPSVAESWWYALCGEQHPAEGSAARICSIGYACLSLPVRTALAYLDWIVDRPARAVVFFGLYALLAQTGLFAWLPWF